jgi:hypothetical protein
MAAMTAAVVDLNYTLINKTNKSKRYTVAAVKNTREKKNNFAGPGPNPSYPAPRGLDRAIIFAQLE